jgi:hypothetical protein
MATDKRRGSERDEAGDRPEALFGLIDVETGNMVGSFPSEREALLAVAVTAREYGADSEAVLSLALFREDVPPEEGGIADGAELVRRALAVVPAAGAPVEHLPT